MKFRAMLMVLGATAGLAGGAAFAQSSSSDTASITNAPGTDASSATSQSPSQTTTTDNPAPPPNRAWQKAMSQEFFRASRLLGKEAQSAKGESLGPIKDVVFNQQGEVFILLDMGEGRLAPVPWRYAILSSSKGRQKVILSTSGAALREAPIVVEDQWGELDNPNFTQGIYAYYQAATFTASGGASSPGSSGQGQGDSPASQTPTTESQQ
jgi:sporulation protein YlmC with PRC-barrel domain